MTTPRRSITILGAGHIGFAMALLLSRSGDYDVLVADRDAARLEAVAALGVATRVTPDDAALQTAIVGRYAVLNAQPRANCRRRWVCSRSPSVRSNPLALMSIRMRLAPLGLKTWRMLGLRH